MVSQLSLIPLHLTTGGINMQQYLKVISKFTEHALVVAFIQLQHSDYLVCSVCSGKYNTTIVLVEAAVQLIRLCGVQNCSLLVHHIYIVLLPNHVNSLPWQKPSTILAH